MKLQALLVVVSLLTFSRVASPQANLFVTLGTPVRGEVGLADQWHGWLFQALAGVQVTWKLSGRDGLLPHPYLDGPDGEVDLSAALEGLGTDKVVVRDLVLPADGLYRFRLQGEDGTTGRYRVRAQVTTPPEHEHVMLLLAAGDPGTSHRMRFRALAGSKLSGRIRLTAGPVAALDGLLLTGPAGPLTLGGAARLSKNGRVIRIHKLPLALLGDHVLELGGPLGPLAAEVDLRIRAPKVAGKTVPGELLPGHVDSDGDGLLDIDEELVYGTDPQDADSDDDGLPDGQEVLLHGTDPLLSDTDGDTLPDAFELAVGSDPLSFDVIVSFIGRVLDFDEQPLAGGPVLFEGFATYIPPTLTTAAGTFELGPWPQGIPARVRVGALGPDTLGVGTEVVGPVPAPDLVNDLGTITLSQLFGRPGVLLHPKFVYWPDAFADLDADGCCDAVAVRLTGSEVIAHSVVVVLGDPSAVMHVSADVSVPYVPPRALEVGELDGDGTLDVLAGTTVLTGDGQGGLSIWKAVFGSAFPYSLAIADMDGDGALDVLGRSGASIRIVTELQSSDPQMQTLDGISNFQGLDAGDMDGDGFVDLVVPGDGLLYGQGGGVLGPAEALPVDGFPVLADVDNDGGQDILFSDGSSQVSIVRELSPGARPTVSTLSAGADVFMLQVLDLDADGALDIAASASPSVAVFGGDGTGAFVARPPFVSNAFGHIADADADGSLDLIYGSGGSLFVLPDAAGKALPGMVATVNAAQMQAVDVSGDGNPDLTLGVAGALAYLPSTSVPGSAQLLSFPGPLPSEKHAHGDVDGDGDADIAWTMYTSPMLALREGDGYVSGPTVGISGYLVPPYLVADFRSQGRADLLGIARRTSAGERSLQLFSWDGLALAPSHSESLAGFVPDDMLAGDVDGDGVLDLVAFEGGTGTLIWWPGTGSPAPLALFGAPQSLFTSVGGRMRLGDLDGDGRSDIVTRHTGSLTVVLGRASGPLTVDFEVPVTTECHDLELGDVNGDGLLDAVSLDWSLSTLSVFLGDGTGTLFGPQVYFARGHELELIDHDLDGRLDVACNFKPVGVTIFERE